MLTGGNGCGKTQLLNLIYEKLKNSIIDRKNYILIEVERNLENCKQQLNEIGPAQQHYNFYTEQIELYSKQLEEIRNPPLVITNLDEFVVNYQELKALLTKFEAMRKSEITKPTSVTSINSLKEQDKQFIQQSHRKDNTSTLFELFLVTNKANQAFSESEKIKNDPIEAEKIEKWFSKLESDLRNLFEDKDLKLVFQSDSFTFEIHQPYKAPYTFQTLSSSFSSIMAIYADLITKVSLRSIAPDELTGIVLIDEIDAHLHVSLQKKILSFFTQAFPKVQFIVTTHSPFVVSSIDDAVIYDLSKQIQVTDLSMYSYESVLEGLFGVLPISNLLQEHIENIAKLLDKPSINTTEIQALLDKIPQDETSLDSESLYYVNSAKLAINKAKR
ncbi:AAA family ATPase [Photobacterium leiognathi subsp. mandapamensis]|nr:AAA family ATPase [Photobacterium leiognathi subsp. mandapamensis]